MSDSEFQASRNQESGLPADLLVVGYVAGAYGIKGWVRIRPYSDDPAALLQSRTWWIDKPTWRDVDMLEAKNHSGDVVAKLMGVADRDAAERLKGATVHIRRAHFPALSDDEFYWVDLVGLVVENLDGVVLGTVSGLMENGAHPILRVGAAASAENRDERLIPFVDQFVKSVDMEAKKIVVDWGVDY